MADSSVRWRVGTAVLVAALLSLIGLWWGPPRLAEAVAGEWMRELPPNDSFPRVAVDATGMYIFGRVDWDPNAFDRVFTSRYALDGTPSWRIETTDMRHMGAAAITTHEGTVYSV